MGHQLGVQVQRSSIGGAVGDWSSSIGSWSSGSQGWNCSSIGWSSVNSSQSSEVFSLASSHCWLIHWNHSTIGMSHETIE